MPVNTANKLYPPVQVVIDNLPPVTSAPMSYLTDSTDHMFFLSGDIMSYLGV